MTTRRAEASGTRHSCDGNRPRERGSLLLAASGGGHLAQLWRLADRVPWPDCPRIWFTEDSPQARSLLEGEEVVFAEKAGPRDAVAAAANVRHAKRLLSSHDITHAVSTGASIAVSTLPLAALHGTDAHYVESAARVDGPSLSGRMLEMVPGVRTYTQYGSWAGGRWAYAGSVFDGYEPGPARVNWSINRVVVTLGTQDGYAFRTLVEALARALPAGADVFWQTGNTHVADLGVRGRVVVPARELDAAVAGADLVVTHAGVGSALAALKHGHCPLLVPRRRVRGEHVDDHQVQICSELVKRGLGVSVEAGVLDRTALEAAAGRSVLEDTAPRRLDLIK